MKFRGTLFYPVQASKTKCASCFLFPKASPAIRADALSIMVSMPSIVGDVVFLELNLQIKFVNAVPPTPNVPYR